MYEACKKVVNKQIRSYQELNKRLNALSITIDYWTSNANDSYLGLTGYYMWNLTKLINFIM